MWAHYTTTHYESAIKEADKLGWKDKNVQVRVEFIDHTAHYYVEPYEKDCHCPHILKYNEHIRP